MDDFFPLSNLKSLTNQEYFERYSKSNIRRFLLGPFEDKSKIQSLCFVTFNFRHRREKFCPKNPRSVEYESKALMLLSYFQFLHFLTLYLQSIKSKPIFAIPVVLDVFYLLELLLNISL